ncbi:MAG: c-type cytochrome [Cyclobacteriaceae bacterium]|nr:c-type cytochrome [Cyclobacteriaceae bacterium]
MIKVSLYSITRSITTFVLFFTLSVSFAQEIPETPEAIADGESLFNANCKTCHRVHQKLVGPALANVYDRAPSIDWLKAFIKNSAAVIASGDDYAVNIYNEYNKTQMTAFTGLKDDQLMNLLAYIKAETEKGPPVAATTTAAGGEGTGSGVPAAYLNIILVGMLVILTLLVIVLLFLVSALKRFLDQKDLSEEDKEVINSPYTVGSITASAGFRFIMIFIIASLGFKWTINTLFSVGVQQGYAPKQPIAFSHKLHAGAYEIDCKYCHVGAMVGKNATIPSVNICMNCHRSVKTESAQIQKLWAAADWQPETLTFGPNQKPIEWVRIHNLPDLAYFNHAQHVNVGNIECQTCHGPIEEMEVVKQYSLLTMGWCIDCHRKTDVNTKGNEYYDKLVELHNQANKEPMKVEDIGGLDCAKCHY